MSDRSDLMWHRASLLGDIVACHRWLQVAGQPDRPPTCALLVADDGPETDAVCERLQSTGIQMTRTRSSELASVQTPHDVVIRLGAPSAGELAPLARLVGRDGLLMITARYGSAAVDLIDALRNRFASVLELAQTRVTGSAITNTAQALGFPQIVSWTPGGGPPTPGAPHEHSVILAGDRSLHLYPTHSVLRRSTVAQRSGVIGSARRFAGRAMRGVQRRVSEGGATAEHMITLPSHPTPVLSIVIPVHGKWAITEQCLASLEALGIETPCEVIVVNDASPDDTIDRLRRVRGARVIDLKDNVGFLQASNAGTDQALGDLVLFLNNDTIPQPGSIDRMVERMQSDSSIGVVGAKLVYLDRSLQEAGGVVWDDASAWNVGRNEDPANPKYSYPCDVDYCSGAALLVRRSLLDETGGFDLRYSPAYYEDTDLCFEARKRGMRVVYEPSARVVHLEGQSHGVSVDSGIKRYQEVNRAKFAAKWETELRHHLPPDASNLALARSRHAARRILVVDHTVPTYDRDGGSLRMVRLLRILRDLGCFVWFYPADRLLRQPYTAAVLDLGVEVIGPNDDLPSLLRQIGSGLDAAIVSRRGIAWQVIDTLRQASPSTPVIFDTVDVHFVREESEAAQEGDKEAAAGANRGRQMELALVGITDQTWVVSSEELALLGRLVPYANIRLVPNVHEAEPTSTPFEDRHDLLFVGNFNHPPNVDALVWAIDEILPKIWEKLPDVKLHVVGDALPTAVRERMGEGCVAHGWVEDLTPMYASTRVVLAPLRYGAGMKGKVAQALGMGVPVVTTPTGTEGMPPEIRRLVFEGDTAGDIARLTIDAYNDATRWGEIHDAAPRAVEEAYGQAAVKRMVADALDQSAR